MSVHHTVIIAEAGVNHNGSLETAKEMVDRAAEAGVDYIKFQTFKADRLVTRTAEKAAYQTAATGSSETQYEMLKKLELSEADHCELLDYCNAKGVRFLSTAFDLESIDFLASLGMTLWKVPSGEITNYPYLRKIARQNGDVILSTGMSDLDGVRQALKVLADNGQDINSVVVLHCNTQYPTPMRDVNLRAMLTVAGKLNVRIGYSDHTVGTEVPIAAVALGAEVIEKHFTLDRNLPGPDQKASIEPDELKYMVTSIRSIEQALGDGVKEVTNSERANIAVARKSIVAKRHIAKGEVLTEENMDVKRPGTGLSPMLWPEILGMPAVRDFEKDEQIEL